MSTKPRLGVLLSGRGSNFVSLQNAIQEGHLSADIAVVIGNVAGAPGLNRAREFGLHTLELPSKGIPREEFDARVLRVLRENDCAWICLAGYMRVLSPGFIAAYPQRIVNIHPSLLPAFPGLHAQQQAFEHGVRVAGCTVHLVDEGLDSGPIIAQAAVAVEAGDSSETLAARILREEHRLYPAAMQRLLTQPWKIEGRRLIFPAD
jgi:phosphoribosylglycinamide formyltransferase 1